ncbi:hypothetical protein [Pseudomonas asplenii]|uniref:hypothetical protein n=1 Tax=Pseudomonas asplenii TaxID=53407 RepID=UPI002360A854|nr:hypothetical protein [Pseudomonas asplenii]
MYSRDPLTPSRPDTWSPHNEHCRVQYQVRAEAEPDLLCRLLNLFALQLLTPLQVQARQDDGVFLIELELDDLSWHRAEVIGEKMRNLISVFAVHLQPAAQAQPTRLQAAG